MSAEQFKAAGLDKLNASELAALNDWLQGKVAKEAAVVVEQAKEAGRQEVIVKNRGFFDFGSKEPIESTLVGEFRGFSKGSVYTMANDQQWEQTDAASLSGVRKDAPRSRSSRVWSACGICRSRATTHRQRCGGSSKPTSSHRAAADGGRRA